MFDYDKSNCQLAVNREAHPVTGGYTANGCGFPYEIAIGKRIDSNEYGANVLFTYPIEGSGSAVRIYQPMSESEYLDVGRSLSYFQDPTNGNYTDCASIYYRGCRYGACATKGNQRGLQTDSCGSEKAGQSHALTACYKGTCYSGFHRSATSRCTRGYSPNCAGLPAGIYCKGNYSVPCSSSIPASVVSAAT